MRERTHIENIVAKIHFDQRFNLKDIVQKARGFEYNPESFPAMIYKIMNPRVSLLIFSTGNVVLTGAKSSVEIEDAIKLLIEKMESSGVEILSPPTVEVNNIVASSNIEKKINLDVLAINCMNTEYEPEQFPALVMRFNKPKTTVLVFRTGKLVITGAKKTKDVDEAFELVKQMIDSQNAYI